MRQGQAGACDAVFDGRALVRGWFFEHPICNLRFHTRVANANAQSPVLVCAELCMDIAQTIVTRMAATEFKFGFARCDVQLVVDHQNFFWLDFEEARQCTHRLAREIHEGLGL